MTKKKEILASIDVGTTKICSTVARTNGEEMDILGTGWAPSRGLKKGVVVNLSETIESVKASVEEAEKSSQSPLEAAHIGVGGAHLRGINCHGQTEVRNKNRKVTGEDIRRAVNVARSRKIPKDHQIIHLLTQSFEVDGQYGVVNPMGMSARHLSVHVHLVLNASSVVQNIISAINQAGVLVKGVVMQQLASAEAVLSPDEKELGAVLIDIGGGTIDIAIYAQGSVCYSKVIALGGNLITKDIAIGLKIPLQEAEQLKRNTANVFPESVLGDELIEVSQVGTGLRRTISRRLLCQIVRARCDEILDILKETIHKAGVQSDFVTGAVLTGGGSMLDGMVDLTEQNLRMPIRVGYPINVLPSNHAAFHPAYSTAVGLLKYSQGILSSDLLSHSDSEQKSDRRGDTGERLKNWFLRKIG